jgi:hypothetical protein
MMLVRKPQKCRQGLGECRREWSLGVNGKQATHDGVSTFAVLGCLDRALVIDRADKKLIALSFSSASSLRRASPGDRRGANGLQPRAVPECLDGEGGTAVTTDRLQVAMLPVRVFGAPPNGGQFWLPPTS